MVSNQKVVENKQTPNKILSFCGCEKELLFDSVTTELIDLFELTSQGWRNYKFAVAGQIKFRLNLGKILGKVGKCKGKIYNSFNIKKRHDLKLK